MARPRKQTYTLDMYLKKIKDGDICNDADVQRHFVWTKEQINELVVTVLTDEYIPPVILGEEDSSQLHIADGGQRSSALNQFRYGNYKITSSIENSIIPYKKKIKNKDGNIIWKDTIFDIKNKTYDKLPDELKKKFDEYQIDTVIHEHCDSHRISQYIKRYNNHTSMNANQKAFTYLDNFAGYIREILSSRFFLDYSVFSESEKTKGVVERVVVETVMCSNYFDNWKKQQKAACRYLNEHASKEDFEKLMKNIHRLENIITDEIKEIFNSKDSFLFITLFDSFTKLGLEDSKFAQFLVEFKKNMRNTRRNATGMLFDEIDKDRSTKDKVVIAAKLAMLEECMKEFLYIQETGNEEEDLELFISDMVGLNEDVVHENIDWYVDMLDGEQGYKEVCIKDGSKLLDKNNTLSLLGIVAYAESMGQSLDTWLTEYASKNDTYFVDQRSNFLHMKKDFDDFLNGKSKRSA